MEQIGKTLSRQLSTTSSEPPDRSEYLRLAGQLMRCFRTGEAQDPHVFLTAVVSVMMRYPLDIVAEICDPYLGIPGKQNWIPTPFEIRKACDDLLLPRLRRAESDARIAAQLDERKRIEDQGGLPRQSFEEVKAEMAARGVFFGHGRVQAVETPSTVKAKFNLTDEQWAAIPNAPPRQAE